MNRRLLMLTAIAAVAVIMLCVGCLMLPPKQQAKQIKNPLQVYQAATESLKSADNIILNISKIRQTTLNGSSLTEHSNQKISINNDETLKVEETSTIGSHDVSITEYFSDGTAYAQVQDGYFSCVTSLEDYNKRLTPPVLIDAGLYQNITGIDNGEFYVISFSKPSIPEIWCAKAASGFLDASGAAHVSYDGTLMQTVYDITYTQGNAIIRLNITVQPQLGAVEITLPEDLSQYIPISYLDGPRTLERATGYLTEAKNISAVYNDSIYFQAFGEERTQSITLYCNAAKDWSALVNTEVTLQNDARNDKIVNSKTELFQNGQYKSAENSEDYTLNKDITAEDMRSYCQNLMVSTVMLPHHITDAQVAEKENTLLISFTASDEFTRIINENACQSMYQSPQLLNEQAQSNTTDALNCYLEIDKTTGFPVASGIHYTGTYLMEEIPYLLRFNAEQTYDIISLTAKNEIEKAAGA